MCVRVCVCVPGPRKSSSQKGQLFFFFFFKNEVCVPTGFLGGSVVKNLPANAGDTDPLEKEMAILQYSCLGNPMDRGTRWATVHGVTK